MLRSVVDSVVGSVVDRVVVSVLGVGMSSVMWSVKVSSDH